MKDFYRILEVHPEASPEVIHKAYRTLAQRSHPDRYHVTDKARLEERMKTLNEAYETLSNPQRRKLYDAYQLNLKHPVPKTDAPAKTGINMAKLGYWFLLTILVAVLFRAGLEALLMLPFAIKLILSAGLLLLLRQAFKR